MPRRCECGRPVAEPWSTVVCDIWPYCEKKVNKR